MSSDQAATYVVLRVRGHVQGVGFRWWTRELLDRLDLEGTATNLIDGSVEVRAHGPRTALDELVRAVRDGGAPGRVDEIDTDWSAPSAD